MDTWKLYVSTVTKYLYFATVLPTSGLNAVTSHTGTPPAGLPQHQKGESSDSTSSTWFTARTAERLLRLVQYTHRKSSSKISCIPSCPLQLQFQIALRKNVSQSEHGTCTISQLLPLNQSPLFEMPLQYNEISVYLWMHIKLYYRHTQENHLRS